MTQSCIVLEGVLGELLRLFGCFLLQVGRPVLRWLFVCDLVFIAHIHDDMLEARHQFMILNKLHNQTKEGTLHLQIQGWGLSHQGHKVEKSHWFLVWNFLFGVRGGGYHVK